MRLLIGWGLAALVAAGPGAAGATAQSALERSPNLEGIWASRPGTIHFHFLHRFSVTDAPVRKVLNTPTFLLATGVPGDVLLGARYASNSQLVSSEPNEWEAFARWAGLRQEHGLPVDVAVQGGRNMTAESWEGELMLGRDLGPLRLLASGRAFSAFRGGDARWAVAGGARLRLTRWVALAADVAQVVDTEDLADDGGRDAAWSAGIQLEIPYTPHSLSVHASNANTTTLQGSSFGSGERRWGFEFTVPITLSRYFGGREGSERTTAAAPPSPGATGAGSARDGVAAEVEMSNRLLFAPDTVRIRVGETVWWRNTSVLIHTVTADPSKAAVESSVNLPAGAEPFDSGDIAPGEAFTYTFTVLGEYRYFCIPHEQAGMVATVIVEAAGG